MRQLLIIFASVFFAEIGDKTQLATMLFATDQNVSKVGIFAAATLALTLATLLAVVAGDLANRVVSPATLKLIAGVGFIVIGVWTVISASR